MKQFFFTISYLLVLNVANSQSTLTIKGIILQSSDSLPVYNVHIFFKETDIGTTSNENGEFAFHFSNKFKGAEITISAIGFETIHLKDSDTNQPLVVYLNEDIQLLDNVTITVISPLQILKNAVKNLKINYNQEKVSKEIYYKEEFSTNDKPIRYLEVVATLYTDGFSDKRKNPDSYSIFIKQKRPGFNFDPAFEGGNGIGVLHWLLWTERYFKKNNLPKFDIELMGKTEYRNEDVYKLKIRIPEKTQVETFIYITQTTYSILAINENFGNKNAEIPSVKQNFRFLKSRQYVDFQQLDDGYWYINSIDDYREAIDSEGIITEIKRSIRVTAINQNVKLNIKNRITRETDLYKYQVPYNPEFWENYNAPPETEEEKKIKAELIK